MAHLFGGPLSDWRLLDLICEYADERYRLDFFKRLPQELGTELPVFSVKIRRRAPFEEQWEKIMYRCREDLGCDFVIARKAFEKFKTFQEEQTGLGEQYFSVFLMFQNVYVSPFSAIYEDSSESDNTDSTDIWAPTMMPTHNDEELTEAIMKLLFG